VLQGAPVQNRAISFLPRIRDRLVQVVNTGCALVVRSIDRVDRCCSERPKQRLSITLKGKGPVNECIVFEACAVARMKRRELTWCRVQVLPTDHGEVAII